VKLAAEGLLRVIRYRGKPAASLAMSAMPPKAPCSYFDGCCPAGGVLLGIDRGEGPEVLAPPHLVLIGHPIERT
jgi:hypothetical protein